MSREFTIVIERDEEGYYVGSVPSIQGCHTQGKTMDELLQRMKEVIILCLEDEEAEASERLELVGIQKIAV